MPLSDRLTRSTSAACRSIDMFLCRTPIPPARAMAIAISDSVTVSIAAETSGTFSLISRVKREAVLTSRGCTNEWRGDSRTSSKVSAASVRMRDSTEAGRVPCRATLVAPGRDPLRDAGALAGALAGRLLDVRRDVGAIVKVTD